VDVPDGMSIPDELARREERLRRLAAARAKIAARAKERFARRAGRACGQAGGARAKTKATGKKPGGGRRRRRSRVPADSIRST